MGIFDSSSTAAATAPVPQADGDSSPVSSVDTCTYVVVKRDSLSTIASGLHEANRDLIRDSGLIYPGQQQRIPE